MTGNAGVAAAADVIRQMQDRCEIEALMWRYVRTLDRFDAAAYPDLYTPDGCLGEGASAIRGRENLARAVLEMKQRFAQAPGKMHHVVTNTCIEFLDHDTARMNYYWMQVFSAGAGGEAPRVASAGRGVDLLARIEGRWLIRQRIVTPED